MVPQPAFNHGELSGQPQGFARTKTPYFMAVMPEHENDSISTDLRNF